MELFKTQVASIEDKQSVIKLSQNTRIRNANSKQNGSSPGNSHPVDLKLHDQKLSGKCRNYGKNYPHPSGKTACPTYQAVYESKSKGENRNAGHSNINKVAEGKSSNEDEMYTFTLNIKPTSKDQPLIRSRCMICLTQLWQTLEPALMCWMRDYRRLPNGPKLETTSV